MNDELNSFDDAKLQRFEQMLKSIQPRSAQVDPDAIVAASRQSAAIFKVSVFTLASCCGGSALAGVLLGFVLFGTSGSRPLSPSPSPLGRGEGSNDSRSPTLLGRGEGSEDSLSASPPARSDGGHVFEQNESINIAQPDVHANQATDFKENVDSVTRVKTPRRLTVGYLISKSDFELLMDDLPAIEPFLSDSSFEEHAIEHQSRNDQIKSNTYFQLRKEAQL